MDRFVGNAVRVERTASANYNRQETLEDISSQLRAAVGQLPIQCQGSLPEFLEITVDIFDRLVGFVSEGSPLAVVRVCELEFIAVAADLGDPIDDKPVRNDPVIVDALIGYDCMDKPRLKFPVHRTFAFEGRHQIPKVSAIVFYVKGKRAFPQAVV